MKCGQCGGLVQWQGPLINLTHSKCTRCGAINSQTDEDYILEEQNETQEQANTKLDWKLKLALPDIWEAVVSDSLAYLIVAVPGGFTASIVIGKHHKLARTITPDAILTLQDTKDLCQRCEDKRGDGQPIGASEPSLQPNQKTELAMRTLDALTPRPDVQRFYKSILTMPWHKRPLPPLPPQ